MAGTVVENNVHLKRNLFGNDTPTLQLSGRLFLTAIRFAPVLTGTVVMETERTCDSKHLLGKERPRQ